MCKPVAMRVASQSPPSKFGKHPPVVVPGDPEGSILGQWLLGTHPGGFMPPGDQLPDPELETILDWIEAGALDN